MSTDRRAFLPGGTYFFTVVTFDRRPILTSELSRSTLREAWQYVQERRPLTVDAICLLPDHLHCIWALPDGDTDYSTRWSAIKALFAKKYLTAGGREVERSASRSRKGEAAIWQRRFWEHCVRDQADFNRHVDYIHFNPVKHGLVESPRDWVWSSFHRYAAAGQYGPDWGAAEPESIKGVDWSCE